MSQLRAIAYVSTATREPSEDDLEALLTDARDFNQQAGVTGALLLHDVTFFQYFEGAPSGVEQVYERIRKSSLHRDIHQLLDTPIGRREFARWHMGFQVSPKSLVLQLAGASWTASVPNMPSGRAASDGLQLLLDFWHRSRRSLPGGSP